MIYFHYVLGIILLLQGISGSTWDAVKGEHEKLYLAYSINNFHSYINTISKDNFSTPLDVSLQMEMTSLGGYDAVNGAIEIIGSLNMTWTDEIGTLNNAAFDTSTATEILVDYRKLWTPVIVLMNSADSVQRVGDESYKVRFNLATGKATWKPRMIIKASCTPDVSYFPFDQQNCTLLFTAWFLKKENLTLSVSSNSWDMDNYDKNGVWGIESTESYTFISGDYYYASFTITFTREPTYFTVTLVLPILFLSLLSGLVFLLPAASGERTGFVITCFLTFVILLQTTMTFLPQASAPMSLLCYYVIVMMLFSAFLSLANALLLRVYHKPKGENVPRWLIHVIEIIKCIKFRRIICRKKFKSVDDSSENSRTALHPYQEKGIRNIMPERHAFNPKRLEFANGGVSGLSVTKSKTDTTNAQEIVGNWTVMNEVMSVENSSPRQRSNVGKVVPNISTAKSNVLPDKTLASDLTESTGIAGNSTGTKESMPVEKSLTRQRSNVVEVVPVISADKSNILPDKTPASDTNETLGIVGNSTGINEAVTVENSLSRERSNVGKEVTNISAVKSNILPDKTPASDTSETSGIVGNSIGISDAVHVEDSLPRKRSILGKDVTNISANKSNVLPDKTPVSRTSTGINGNWTRANESIPDKNALPRQRSNVGKVVSYISVDSTDVLPEKMAATDTSESSESQGDQSDIDDVDWESVGRVLDTFFILVFIGVQCAFSLFFLVPLGTRA